MTAEWLRHVHVNVHWDLVVGTSIGGLLAVLIGLGYTPDYIADTILSLTNVQEIFHKSVQDRLLSILQTEPKYTGRAKWKLIQQYLSTSPVGQLRSLLHMSDLKYRTLLTGWNITLQQLHIFDHTSPQPLDHICQVISNPPLFMPTLPDPMTGHFITDGGMAGNDPLLLAWQKAQEYFPGESCEFTVLGTGIVRSPHWSSSSLPRWGGIQWLTHGFLDLLIQAPCLQTRQLLQAWLEQHPDQHPDQRPEQRGRLDIWDCAIPDIPIDTSDEDELNKLLCLARDYVKSRV